MLGLLAAARYRQRIRHVPKWSTHACIKHSSSQADTPCRADRGGGYRDSVLVSSDHKVRLAVQFLSFADPKMPYMFHCHILKHEDNGMRGQFVVVEPGTEDTVPRTIGGTHHH